MKVSINEFREVSDTLDAACKVMHKIQEFGYKAYIMGGTPRDILLGKALHEIDDIDIATDCPVDYITKLFKTYNIGRSKSFGIVLVDQDGFHFEVAHFRKDEEYINGRHPTGVDLNSTLEEDVLRRDFTINALALDLDGNIIDHVGGIDDIKSRKLRAVGDPYKRFAEDRLRMIRLARFQSLLNFRLDAKTRRACRRLAPLINAVARERIRAEFMKIGKYGGKIFSKFIVNMDKMHLLNEILPEVSVLKYFYHKLKHHPEGKTVFQHVIKCVEICEGGPIDLIAALLHDVGKGVTFTDEDGEPHYKRHDHAGKFIASDICDRMGFSNNEKEAIVYAVANHMKFHKLMDMKPSKVARLVDNPYFEVLVNVGRADEFSRGETFMFAGSFEKQIDRVRAIKEEWQNRVAHRELNLVSGEIIMNLLDIKPGPLVGKIKNSVQDAIIDGGLDPFNTTIIESLIHEKYEELNND